MKCPSCKDTVLTIAERKGIEIDFCPHCRGIWLERGELDKILERARQEDSAFARDRGSYQSSSPGHADYQHKHYKRKKSFFEELFD